MVIARRRHLLVLALLLLAPASSAADSPPVFSFFWKHGCPHCVAVRPFLKTLQKENPRLVFEEWEVSRDKAGRRRFIREAKRLGIKKAVVPTFVCGKGYVQGYAKGQTEPCLRALVRRCMGK